MVAATVEPVLWAACQLFGRQIAGRIADVPLQFILRPEVGAFCGHQPQHRDLVFGHEARRREIAGALAVIFQQQPLMLQAAKQVFGDAVIGAFAVPCLLIEFGTRCLRLQDGGYCSDCSDRSIPSYALPIPIVWEGRSPKTANKLLIYMVGAAGFEPTTPCPPVRLIYFTTLRTAAHH